MLKFILNTFDVLFFGAGKPFNINVQETSSIFPPFPTTLAGSVCNKIYTKKKINTERAIKNFYGPFLEKEGKILFPKPFDILGEKKKVNGELSSTYLLKNSKLINPSHTDSNDLKEILWQEKKDKDFNTFESFITMEGLKKWLNSQEINKSDLIPKNEVFEFEPRIGIRLEYSKKVVKEEDALYRIDFIRLKKDVQIIFFVEFNHDNEELKKCNFDNEDEIFNFFNNEPKVLKLGGEMKTVYYKCEKDNIIDKFAPFMPSIENGDIVKILYLTPGFLERDSSYEIISGSIKSKNLGMYTKSYGIKIRKAIKEGSVLYVKVMNKENFKNIWMKPKDGEFIGANLRIYAKL